MFDGPIIKKIWTNSTGEIDTKLKNIPTRDLVSAPYVVLKTTRLARHKLYKDRMFLAQMIHRTSGKPVYFLNYDRELHTHRLHKLKGEEIYEEQNATIIDEIRTQDLREIVNRTPSPFLEAPIGHHFVTPSGKHTKVFLRVADMIQSYNALDRISFWLLPHLATAAAVIVDTWNLASIVLHAQKRLGRNTPFNCFREHITSDEEGGLKMLRQLSEHIPKEGPVISLVGISSSGHFVNQVKRLTERADIDNPLKSVSIYRFRNTSVDGTSLSTLGVDIEYYDNRESCVYCKEKEIAYPIDSQLYYPRAYMEKEIMLPAKCLETSERKESSAKQFFGKYGGATGAFKVHRDDPHDGANYRHHAFFIDVQALLDSSVDFREEVANKMREIVDAYGEPDVVVIPPHAAAEAIAALGRGVWDAPVVKTHNLRDVADRDRSEICKAKHICILDDAIITGTRIRTYIRALRENFTEAESSGFEAVTIFPLISRPETRKQQQRLLNSLKKHKWKNALFTLYELRVPNWDTDECPWCKERAIIERKVGAAFEESGWFSQRQLQLLYDTDTGIDNPLLVLPGDQRKVLGTQSPLAPAGASETEVLFRVAVGLQWLRSDFEKPLGRGMLTSYVLDSESNLTQYSEPLIQACLLRSSRTTEWDTTVLQTGISYLCRELEKGEGGVLGGEVLLFLHRCIGTKVLSKDIKHFLDNVSKDDDSGMLAAEFMS